MSCSAFCRSLGEGSLKNHPAQKCSGCCMGGSCEGSALYSGCLHGSGRRSGGAEASEGGWVGKTCSAQNAPIVKEGSGLKALPTPSCIYTLCVLCRQVLDCAVDIIGGSTQLPEDPDPIGKNLVASTLCIPFISCLAADVI